MTQPVAMEELRFRTSNLPTQRLYTVVQTLLHTRKTPKHNLHSRPRQQDTCDAHMGGTRHSQTQFHHRQQQQQQAQRVPTRAAGAAQPKSRCSIPCAYSKFSPPFLNPISLRNTLMGLSKIPTNAKKPYKSRMFQPGV